MLDDRHRELLARYGSEERLAFNSEELELLFTILSLKIRSFDATRLPEYRKLIYQALKEQNKVMTELGGEFLNRAKRDSKLAVMNYLVANIGRIRSPYMLSILIDLLCYDTNRARRASRRRRNG